MKVAHVVGGVVQMIQDVDDNWVKENWDNSGIVSFFIVNSWGDEIPNVEWPEKEPVPSTNYIDTTDFVEEMERSKENSNNPELI